MIAREMQREFDAELARHEQAMLDAVLVLHMLLFMCLN